MLVAIAIAMHLPMACKEHPTIRTPLGSAGALGRATKVIRADELTDSVSMPPHFRNRRFEHHTLYIHLTRKEMARG